MSFRKDVLLLLLRDGPKTMTEIAEALGVSMQKARDNVHPMASELLLDRQAGDEGVVEYRISRNGRVHCKRNYVEALMEHGKDAHDRAAEAVIAEVEPVETVIDTQTTQDEAAAIVATGASEEPAEITFECPPEHCAAYFLREPGTGALRPLPEFDEYDAIQIAKNLAEETGEDVHVYRLARIGSAVHCVVFSEL
jgi:DNA-binding MarR family transcriptional regulator